MTKRTSLILVVALASLSLLLATNYMLAGGSRYESLSLENNILEVYPPTVEAQGLTSNGLVLWNKLGSDYEVLHSEVGANGKVIGTSHAYEPAQHGDGYVRKATGQNYVQFPGSVLNHLAYRGTIELWINPKVPKPVPYKYGVFGLIGAPYGHGGVPSARNIHLIWGDTVSGQGLQGRVGFEDMDGSYAVTPQEPTQFVATVGVPFHAAISWDLDGIDGTDDTVRVYRNGIIVGSTESRWNPNGATERYDIILGYGPDYGGFDKFISDNIKIWNYAKTDFSDRFNESPHTVYLPLFAFSEKVDCNAIPHYRCDG